jgi:DNA replication protein DnaC
MVLIVNEIEFLAKRNKLGALVARWDSLANVSHDELLKEILKTVDENRHENVVTRNLRQSGIINTHTFNEMKIDQESYPWLNLSDVNELMTCDFIKKGHDVIALGPPGAGKTCLAKSIATEAINKEYKVLYRPAYAILNEMMQAFDDRKLISYKDKLRKIDLLIIDDLGYTTFAKELADYLFQIIDMRYCDERSTYIATNLEFSKWSECIPDQHLVSAVVDRLIHRGVVLNMNVKEGFRVKEAKARKMAVREKKG